MFSRRGTLAVACLATAVLMLDIAADAYPGKAERSGALAAYGATIGAAFAIGPLAGGALTSGFGWRAVFFVNVPLGILAPVATRRWVRESRDPAARSLDWPGQATLSAGLFLLVFALLRANAAGWGSAGIVASLAGAAALLAAFVAIEHRVASPMLPLGLFRRRDFTGAQVGAFAISASFSALFLYTTLGLQEILGLPALSAGLVYLPGTFLVFIVSGASAQLGDKVAPGTMIALGLALTAAGLLIGAGVAAVGAVGCAHLFGVLRPRVAGAEPLPEPA